MLWFYFYFFNSPSEIYTEIFTDKMVYLEFASQYPVREEQVRAQIKK